MADITQPTFADGTILTAAAVNDVLYDFASSVSYEQLNGKLSLANLDAAFKVEADMVVKGTLVRIARVSASSFLEIQKPGEPVPVSGACMTLDIPAGTWDVLVSWSLAVDVLQADFPNSEFFVSRDARALTAVAGTSYRGEGLYQGSFKFLKSGGGPVVEALGVWVSSGDNVQVGARRMCVLMIQV